jgi:tol-pal system protein YbgF
MHKLTRFFTMTGIAALISAAAPVWAESAPVFDVDSFESAGAEQNQDLPMPPPPGEEAAVMHAAPSTVAEGASAPATQQAPVAAQTFQPVQAAPPVIVESGSSNPSDDPTPASSGVSVSTANLSPEQRMHRLEQQLANLQSSQSAQHVESLQNEVQSLRGQIEQLNHQIDKMQAQQKLAKAETTTTAAEAESKVVPGVAVAVAPAPVSKKASKKTQAASAEKSTPAVAAVAADVRTGQPNVAEEQKIYQTAYDYIKAKKYNDAVNALQDMLKKYPSGQFASNAHYWLGELYGLMGKNDNAYTEFSLVISKFPGSPRVSDAQLKVGLILAAQSKWPDAKRAFKQVINTYPGTASARLASEQLKQIKIAGH